MSHNPSHAAYHVYLKQKELDEQDKLAKRAAQGDKNAKHELERIHNSEGAAILTVIGVAVGGTALGIASAPLAPVAFGLALLAKAIVRNS